MQAAALNWPRAASATPGCLLMLLPLQIYRNGETRWKEEGTQTRNICAIVPPSGCTPNLQPLLTVKELILPILFGRLYDFIG